MRGGDSMAAQAFLKANAQHVALWGTAAPTKAEVTGTAGGPLQHEHSVSWAALMEAALAPTK
jgi:hypothetical protein